jgi:putative transposase
MSPRWEPDPNIRRGNHVVYNLHAHLVFVTKYRKGVFEGVSSRYLRAEYTGRINRIATGSAFWAPSYFAGSCGGAPLSIVKEYIENQKRPI